jgi:cytochrome c biogenesis protein CcdA
MKNALFIFRLFISFTYVLAGLLMLIKPELFVEFFNPIMSSIIGIVLIAFGLFRAYRAWFIERA